MQSRLGRYRVLKHLASGGMADLLLGRSDGIEGFTRHVVLKRIRPEFAKDHRFIRMFLDEARVAANLHHQHIVQVHDVGESNGDYFFAMEYIHGEDVRKLLATASTSRTHVPLPVAIALVSAAASGLHYAHERRGNDRKPLGIVHCDVSPSNVCMGYDGSIKVLDFGIARAAMQEEETRSASLKGKLGYMAPEQCRAAHVDRRTDIYALGVMLYELTTTTRLIKKAGTFDMMEQIVHGKITLPQVRRPDLPNELATIIMHAISPDPDRRFQTADEMRVALDQFADRQGLTATSSQLAAYMRKRFGERPEPWLDLDESAEDDLEIPIAPAPAARTSTASWPGVDDSRRSSSIPMLTGTFPQQTGSIERIDAGAIPQRGSAITSNTPLQRAPLVHRITAQKLAIVLTGVVVVLCGIAVWRFAIVPRDDGQTPSSEPTIATAAPQPAAAQPVPAPPPAPAAAAAAIPDPAADPSAHATQSPTAKRSRQQTVKEARTRDKAERTADRNDAKADKPDKPEHAPAQVSMTPTPPAPEPVAAVTPVPPPVPAPNPMPNLQVPPPAVVPAIAPKMIPLAPQNIMPAALEANRIGGDKNLVPDDITQAEIARSGMSRIACSYKLCVASDGRVNELIQIKGSGFAAYDGKIQSAIKGEWRYKPFVIKGAPSPVCSVVRIVYSQK